MNEKTEEDGTKNVDKPDKKKVVMTKETAKQKNEKQKKEKNNCGVQRHRKTDRKQGKRDRTTQQGKENYEIKVRKKVAKTRKMKNRANKKTIKDLRCETKGNITQPISNTLLSIEMQVRLI